MVGHEAVRDYRELLLRRGTHKFLYDKLHYRRLGEDAAPAIHLEAEAAGITVRLKPDATGDHGWTLDFGLPRHSLTDRRNFYYDKRLR